MRTLVLSGGRSSDSAGLGGSERPLNPVEAVWSNLKRSPANLPKQGIYRRAGAGEDRLKPMPYRPGLIEDVLAKTGLDLTLS